MDVTCLSVPNPLSYLVCAGVKDVENRGFGTDFRGTLYIHSTGRSSLRGMPDLSEYPVPVIHEFNRVLGEIQRLHDQGDYIGFTDHGVNVFLKGEESQPEWAVHQYALLSDVYNRYREDPGRAYFRVNAIVGRVDLVDVVKNSPSPWAQKGYFHWVLARPHLFAEPILRSMPSRSGLFTVTIPDADIARAAAGAADST